MRSPCSSTKATPYTSWSIADADTTWEIPAGTSRLRLTLHWSVTTTDRSCGAGWSSDWASAPTDLRVGSMTGERRLSAFGGGAAGEGGCRGGGAETRPGGHRGGAGLDVRRGG